jgi:cell division protein FtsQ
LTKDFQPKNRAYRLPGRNLPDATREKLRQRKYRARLSNLSKAIGPVKAIGFTLIIISLCYLAIVQLRHLFFHTAYFEIKTIKASGNITVAENDIIRTSGISPALNVFMLDKEAVRKRLLEHPKIKDAKVDLEGLYTLHLKIVERKPMMYAKVGSTFYEISDDGIVISTESLGDRELPIITGLKLQTIRSGDSLSEDDSFYIARNWVETLGGKILEKISEINFSNLQNPYLYLDSGVKVFPRSLEDFKKRYDFLRALLDNLRKNNVEPIYLDMRAPSIVVRPRKKTGASEGSRGSVAGG